MSKDDLLETGKGVLASQPFSVLLAAELLSLEEDAAVLRVPVTPQTLHQFGFVHGGVMAYLADNAVAFAAGSTFGSRVSTSALSINYLRTAAGNHLVARASVVHRGRRHAVCRCDVFAVSGDSWVLVAAAQGTVTRL